MSLTALAFLTMYIGGLIAALVRHPIWGLLTYVATFYLHPPVRWWGENLPGIRWSFLAALVTFIAYQSHKQKLRSNGSFFSYGIVRVLFLFTLWLVVQSAWALNLELHTELIVLYVKYMILLYLIFRVIDSPTKLRMFLWLHVAGCFTLGWEAYTTYQGGRFESFGPPNINEANAGGLQLVTGLYTAGALFLAGQLKEKIALTGLGAFIANGIVVTLSRSATLATGTGGILFLLFSPKKHKKLVIIFGAIAAMGFLSLTNPTYWIRIMTLKQAGENVEGMDTGYGRVLLMRAQWKMFKENPLGYGHRGTAMLSPLYLDDSQLTGSAGHRARSSHSTFMTMLVEHGIIGVFVYLYMLWWVFTQLIKLYRMSKHTDDFLALSVAATASALGAIFLGDQFVDYLKLEVRLWFIAILLILPILILHQREDDTIAGDS